MQKILLIISCFFIIILVCLNFFRPITAINEDLGRHILLGGIIMETNTIPKTNLLSYTYPDYPFINSHWGSEVIFFIIQQFFGFNGLRILATGIAFLTIFSLFFFVRNKVSPLALLLTASLYLPILFERTDIRPEIFSMIFLTLFIILLYSYRAKYTRLIFLLIPLEILWTNIHIYFLVGVILLMIFFIDQLVRDKCQLTKNVTTLAIVLVVSTLGTILNPNGIQGTLFPLTVFQNYPFSILENQSIFLLFSLYHQPALYYLTSAIILLFLFLISNFRRTRRIDWLIAITFSFAAIIAFRNSLLFAIVTCIPFALSLSLVLDKLHTYTKEYLTNKYLHILKLYMLGMIALLLLVQISHTLIARPIGIEVVEYGKTASDFYLKHHLRGPLYNNFNSGSYLAYRLYPQKVFVDGRPEAYPKDFFTDIYKPLEEDPQIFQQASNHYNFNTLFISHWDETPFRNTFLINLLQNPDYKLIYLDDYAVIFLKDTKENYRLIQKYKVEKNTFRIPETTDKKALIRYLYFFEKVGWENQKRIVEQQLQKLDPENQTLNGYRNSLKE